MDYLKTLCEDLNIDPDLEKTEAGSYLLPLTKSIQLEVKALDPGVFFFSPISPCPEIKRELLFIQLMKANLFHQGTLGATIGLDGDENLLTLSSALPYDMNDRAFKESLEDFANIIEYWRVEIDRHVKLAQEGVL
ncbi:MAG: hypothetical protein K1000chlam2_01699 [Chlamydiae bacterium]|nr:hypothetical protein [Chlamydiota bacterium]